MDNRNERLDDYKSSRPRPLLVMLFQSGNLLLDMAPQLMAAFPSSCSNVS
jgi:hypothetical protein